MTKATAVDELPPPGGTQELVEDGRQRKLIKKNSSPDELPPRSGTRGIDDAKKFGLYADSWLRILMVIVIAAIFIGLNIAVMDFIKYVFEADLKAAPPVPRIVTTQVLMSLIGATVVQVGIASIAIVSYLFPKNRNAP